MEDSLYHTVLRTSAVTLSLVLLFVSGVVTPVTKQLSEDTGAYLASAIGMYASVEPNGINEITAALTAKESDLAAREAALKERELALGLTTGEQPTADYTTFILTVIVFILVVLMVLNYVLDYLRARRVYRYGQVA